MVFFSKKPVFGKSKKKEIPGNEVFAQVIPKGANINLPSLLNGSKTFGAEDGEMVKVIDKEVGRKATVDSIFNAFTLGTSYLSRKGYTLSIHDLDVPKKVKEITENVITDAEKKTADVIAEFESGKLEAMPGKTTAETRETKIMQILNSVRTVDFRFVTIRI